MELWKIINSHNLFTIDIVVSQISLLSGLRHSITTVSGTETDIKVNTIV